MAVGKQPRAKYMSPNASAPNTRNETRFAPNGPSARQLLKQWANVNVAEGLNSGRQPVREECDNVSSTAIDAIGYDPRYRQLSVTFNSGRTYNYDNVPEWQYDKLCGAPSKGRYFNASIRKYYAYRRVS